MVAGLLALLSLLLSAAWVGFGRPAATTIARCRVAQQASLAVAALSSDLGGYLSDSAGRLGGTSQAPFVGRMQPNGNELWLCFDGGTTPNGIADWASPDTVIIYRLQGNSLIRTNQGGGESFTVANDVQSFAVQDMGGGLFQIQLQFAYRDVTRTYTLMARDP